MSARAIRRAHSRRVKGAVAVAAASGVALVGGASGAQAVTINVTNLNNSGPGSLRQALSDANDTTAVDTVAFAPSLSGRLELAGAPLQITSPITVSGPGADAVTVDRNNTGPVFAIYTSAQLTPVTISGLTLNQGDNTPGLGGGIYSYKAALTVEDVVIDDNVARYGGGIYAGHGTLDVVDSEITDNRATGSGASRGGGIFTNLDLGDTITGSTITGNSTQGDGAGLYIESVDNDVLIAETTIAGNTATSDGGGLFLENGGAGGTFRLETSTVSGNRAESSAGAMALLGQSAPKDVVSSTIANNTTGSFIGGIYAFVNEYGPISIESSTITGNSGDNATNGIYIDNVGGGMGTGTGTVSSSIIAGNAGDSRADLSDDGSAYFVFGNSVVGSLDGTDATPVFTPAGTTKIDVTNPLLGPLQDNGGPTFTMAPALASPAVDAGVSNGLPADQRGLTRTIVQPTLSLSPGSDGTDAGAVELAAVPKPPDPPNPPAPDTKVDGAKVDAKPTQKQKGKKVVITLSAGAAEAVSVEASGSVTLGKKKVALKTVRTDTTGGQQATLQLTPSGKKGSKQILKALKKGRANVPKVLVVVTDRAGNSVEFSPTIKLR